MNYDVYDANTGETLDLREMDDDTLRGWYWAAAQAGDLDVCKAIRHLRGGVAP
jgi:hypothetical protein